MPPIDPALLVVEALRRDVPTLTLLVLVFWVELSRFTRMTRYRVQAAKLSTITVNSQSLSSHGVPSASTPKREVIELVELAVS
jgi:hypothetical protein